MLTSNFKKIWYIAEIRGIYECCTDFDSLAKAVSTLQDLYPSRSAEIFKIMSDENVTEIDNPEMYCNNDTFIGLFESLEEGGMFLMTSKEADILAIENILQQMESSKIAALRKFLEGR